MKVKMRKASITVEAVLVVPLVLMVIFLLLSLKAACLWKKERQPPKAGWNGGFPRYRFRLNR